jgi:hypothetical protein
VIRTIVVLGFALLLASGARAQVKDPAALFPADTCVYAEIRKPGDLAEVLAGWAKKTAFADPLARTHDAVEKEPDPRQAGVSRIVGLAGLLASPELFAELKRFHGVGVGFTGFSKDHRPEFAAAVLTGDSHLAGLAVRALLTGKGNIRRVGTVEGVTVFQHRGPVGPVTDPNTGVPLGPDDDANPLKGHKPTAGTGEPTYAYTPGLFVVGSSPDAVGGVLRRFAGKEKAPSLADLDSFKKSSAERDKGVFLYSVPPDLGAKLDAEKKAGGAVPADLAAVLRFVVNAKAVPVVTGNVLFTPDSVGLVVSAQVDAAAESPLLNLFAGAAATADGFRFAGKDAAAAVTVALPPAADRGKAVVRFLDAVAKANGTLGKLPGDSLTDADRELFAGLAAVTAFAPPKQELPAGGRAFPMLVLHCDTEAAAAKWVASAAKLAQLATGAPSPPTPSSETIGTVKVVSVACDGFPWLAPVHLAPAGSAVVVGLDRKLVAAAATATAGVKPPAFDGPSVGLGVFRPVAYPDLFAPVGRAIVRSLVPAPNPNGGGIIIDDLLPPPPPGGPFAPPPVPLDEGTDKHPAGEKLKKAAAALPPVALRLTRTDRGVRVEAWQRGLDAHLGPLVDGFANWLEKAVGGAVNGGQSGIDGPRERG